MPRHLVTSVLSALALSAPLLAFAEDRPMIEPREAEPLARIAPVVDIVTEINDETELQDQATFITASSTRLFREFDGSSTLSRADIAQIEAEIAARFNRPARISTAQTGLIFEPDLTMLFKPLVGPGQLRSEFASNR